MQLDISPPANTMTFRSGLQKINTQCIPCWGLNKERKKQTNKQTNKQRHSMNFKKAVPTALA